MYRFFEPVIAPILDEIDPGVLVEIGSDYGHGTELLAAWCEKNSAVLHCIDPLPKYDVEEWGARWGDAVVFHIELSLNALVDIPEPDVVLIDGDHNWYTVQHELKMLWTAAKERNRLFPVVFLHDVGWPYGRRDLYYDPETIPPAHRHPHKRGGLVPGQRSLDDEGFNDHLENAIHEGTPRNGVLTAVEDFVDEHEGELGLEVIPGLHGLGIVYDKAASSQVIEAIGRGVDRASLIRTLEAVESDRVDRLTSIAQLERRIEKVKERAEASVSQHRLKAESARAKNEQLKQQHDTLRQKHAATAKTLAEAKAKIGSLETEAKLLRRDLHDAETTAKRVQTVLENTQARALTDRRELKAQIEERDRNYRRLRRWQSRCSGRSADSAVQGGQ